MKNTCLAAASILVFASFTFAQTQQITDPQLPSARVALIDTSRFADDKTGITRYVNAIKQLNREFHSPTEVWALEKRVRFLGEEIASLEAASVVNRDAVQAKKAESERLQLEIRRKSDQWAAAFAKRKKEVLEPIERDIGKALEQFALKRGATMVLDITKMPALLNFDPAADVTEAFIAEYNKNNS